MRRLEISVLCVVFWATLKRKDGVIIGGQILEDQGAAPPLTDGCEMVMSTPKDEM